MNEELKKGDAVEVLDEGLEMLRSFMGPNAKPNHHGTVAEIWDDGTVLVEFPIRGENPHSQVAPYSPELVIPRPKE